MGKDNYLSNIFIKLYDLCQRNSAFRRLKMIQYFCDFFLLLFVKKPKQNSSDNKKHVLVVYNNAFGDGMIWLCAATGLRDIYPREKYYISLICQKGLQSLYENKKIFDEVIAYDFIKSTFNPKTRFGLFKVLREQKYDVVLDPIGSNECTTNVYATRAVCANEKITLLDRTLNKNLCPEWMRNRIYTRTIEVTRGGLSLLEYYAEFIRALGDINFKIILEKTTIANFDLELPKDYFLVFPSASTELKKWPITSYAEIVKRIYDKTKLPILFCGTDSDLASISELRTLIGDIPQYDFVNNTSLLEFIEVIKRAKFVITNDTSTYHIAVINEVPVAIITGGYTYDRYVSYCFEGQENYKRPYIIVHKMDCFNCYNNCDKIKSKDKTWPCLAQISVDDAWKTINEMIDSELRG